MRFGDCGRNQKKRKEYFDHLQLLLVGVDVSKAKHSACIVYNAWGKPTFDYENKAGRDRTGGRATLGFGGLSKAFAMGLSPTPIPHVSPFPFCDKYESGAVQNDVCHKSDLFFSIFPLKTLILFQANGQARLPLWS
jgi:hypothetical protein